MTDDIENLMKRIDALEEAGKFRHAPRPDAVTLGDIEEMVRWWKGEGPPAITTKCDPVHPGEDDND